MQVLNPPSSGVVPVQLQPAPPRCGRGSAQLATLLREHRTQQDAEQAAARQLWQDEGRVFASPTGGALIPDTDYREWKSLLAEAGLPRGRLHDARHTTAAVLLLLEVPLRTVMSIMGWSSVEMAARYQHITDAIRQKWPGRSAG